jgi:phosphotransferase system enzyme I (PtsI)
MIRKGISASDGYAIGTIVLKDNFELSIIEKHIDNVDTELKRLDEAIKVCKTQIGYIKEKAVHNLGADKAEVFESHLMLLDDPEFAGNIKNEIRNKSINAEKAVKNVLENYLVIFESMTDDYIKERAADIKDVAIRILKNLSGMTTVNGLKNLNPNTVLVASDLTPSDTAEFDREKVCAFLTNTGGRNSHSAIIARSLEMPAVVALKDITSVVKQGDTVIVDGGRGEVIINPDEDTLKEYEKKKQEFQKEKEELKKLIKFKSITSYGKDIPVAANIGSPKEVDKAVENGADGIGLFRTEFLFMNRSSMPDENEQFEAYKYVLEKMNRKPVIIRTLDVGSDNQVGYLNLPKEANPFLGYRAIRLCLDQKKIFKTQLRALLRASVYGNLKIMFPLISGIDEIISAKNILNECTKELTLEGYSFKRVQVGIMVEVPAAAIMAEELAQHVDFLSIGTNDLIQYTLAADRMNEKISHLYDPLHPAVLRLIKMTIEGARKAGKWCGMCGEMAGDERYIKLLVDYGLDELSMSVPSILKVKKVILNL